LQVVVQVVQEELVLVLEAVEAVAVQVVSGQELDYL
tara:strand:+ start:478 stop:585 length:108 start_codon:yes stop_codon:yes gene_type:complete